MSTSPAATASVPECHADIFDQLARCERMLTTRELASMLAISPKTIYGYVERNMIPHYKIEASVRFRARDVAEWLRGHGCSRFDTAAPALRPASGGRIRKSA
jgi:excisionase family DNA binding protein